MHFKINQTGRSMVEMLGVLAIIGMLSIGGVASYRYAMQQITINQTIDYFSQIYNAIQSSLINKNSSLHCCSGSNAPQNDCKNSGPWYDEQYDEICTLITPKLCTSYKTTHPGFTIHENSPEKRMTWTYRTIIQYVNCGAINGLKNGSSYSYIGLTFYNQNLCDKVLQAILSSPVYTENLIAVGPERNNSYCPLPYDSNNFSCFNNNAGIYSIGFYFKLDDVSICIAE